LYLKRLKITNFRNYSSQIIEPDKFFNIFSGSNAQGKTNILESIFIACTGKSFRTARETEIINWQKEFSYINCQFETNSRQVEVRVELRPGKKKIEVNGVLARGYPQGWPGIVLFKPEDLILVKGSPQDRRRFLDLEFGPFHPQYGHFLGLYNRVLFQRNNLLREIKDKSAKNDSLRVWNEQLCRYGARLLSMRMDLFKNLSPLIRKIHYDLTGEKEVLDIRYLSSIKIKSPSSEEEIYNQFIKEIQEIEEEEIKRSQSLIGPHRDDFNLYIDNKDARIYGSQGQQRTIVLTLKISQILQWYQEIGEYPILLLDDVLFELDENRRQALLDRVSGLVQTFVTSTDENRIRPKMKFTVKKFIISAGKVVDTKEE
jgi:DNA replication and repair protein RecF